MKLNHSTRAAALALSGVMLAGLTGCGAAANTETAETATATPEATAASAASDETATGETADPYAYLADFSFSDAFDGNGYLKDIKAKDYVTLAADYAAITLPAEVNTVTEEDLNTYINEQVLANFKTDEPVTGRAAAEGDDVNIDYTGTIDGTAFEGGTAEGTDLTLGSGNFIEGFEDQIVGHNAGENFDINVTFPADYGKAELASKDAVFNITLNTVTTQTTPTLSDEWVKTNLEESMGLDSVDALKTFVNDTLLFDQQSQEVYTQLGETAALAGAAPEALTDYFKDYYLFRPYSYSQMYGVTLADFLTQSGYGDVDSYLTQAATSIDSNVRQILTMQAIAEDMGIVCDDATLDAQFESYFGKVDKQEYLTNYGDGYLKMNILHDLVMQKLIENATKA